MARQVLRYHIELFVTLQARNCLFPFDNDLAEKFILSKKLKFFKILFIFTLFDFCHDFLITNEIRQITINISSLK